MLLGREEYCTKFVGFLLYCLFVRPNTPISSQRIVLVVHSAECVNIEPSSGTPSPLDEERRDNKKPTLGRVKLRRKSMKLRPTTSITVSNDFNPCGIETTLGSYDPTLYRADKQHASNRTHWRIQR